MSFDERIRSMRQLSCDCTKPEMIPFLQKALAEAADIIEELVVALKMAGVAEKELAVALMIAGAVGGSEKIGLSLEQRRDKTV